MAAARRTEILEIDLEPFLMAVEGFDAYSKFVTGIKECRVVDVDADGSKKVFFDLDIMKRIQYTIRVKSESDLSKGWARIHWNLVHSDLLTKNDGGWELKVLGPRKLQVIYSLDLDFGFMVPGFLRRKLIETSLPATIQEFYKRAQGIEFMKPATGVEGLLKKAVQVGAGAYVMGEGVVKDTVQMPKEMIREALESVFENYTISVNAEIKLLPKKKEKSL